MRKSELPETITCTRLQPGILAAFSILNSTGGSGVRVGSGNLSGRHSQVIQPPWSREQAPLHQPTSLSGVSSLSLLGVSTLILDLRSLADDGHLLSSSGEIA